MEKSMKILLGVLAGVGLLALLSILFVISQYNSLVSLDTSVDQRWADVETQYQRRADLIPNLMETVKGFAAQEKTVFTEVTQLRSAWASAGSTQEKITAAQGLDSAVSRLLLVAENYPELKSNTNFLALQDELAGSENRVAVARTRYNEAASAYNARIRKVPTNLIASLFGFEKRVFFEAAQGSEKAPVVDFS